MPLPEGYLPREGDVLIAHVKVQYSVDLGETDVHITIGNRYNSAVLKLTEIAGVFARHFDPNDVVRSIDDDINLTGTVIAIHEEFVWVKDGNGVMRTIAANELEPVPVAAVDPIDKSFVDEEPRRNLRPAPAPLPEKF